MSDDNKMGKEKPKVQIEYRIDRLADFSSSRVVDGKFTVELGAEIFAAAAAYIDQTYGGTLQFNGATFLNLIPTDELRTRGCAVRVEYDDGTTRYAEAFGEGTLHICSNTWIRSGLESLFRSKWAAAAARHSNIFTMYDGTVKVYVVDAREERLAAEKKAKDAALVEKMNKTAAEVERQVREGALKTLGIPEDLAYILPDLVEHLTKMKAQTYDLTTPFDATWSSEAIMKSLIKQAPSLSVNRLPEMTRMMLAAAYRIKKNAEVNNAK